MPGRLGRRPGTDIVWFLCLLLSRFLELVRLRAGIREQSNHLAVEGRDVIRLPARDQLFVADDLFVDPSCAGVG